MTRSPAVACALVMAATAFAGCLSAGTGSDALLPAAALPPGFSATAVFPGAYDLTGNFSRVLQPGPLAALPPLVERMASALDGAAIEIGVVRPETPEGTRVPVVVVASPYFRALEDTDLWTLRLAKYIENLVPHGYAVAAVPVRGTADMGSCFDFMGDQERADLDQAITWLGEQPWSSGRIGMVGLSYDGSTPWEVAGLGNPYLKTIVPVSGVNDLYHLMYHNGSREARGGALGMTYGYYEYGWTANNPSNGRDPEHTILGVPCPGMWETMLAAGTSHTTGARDPFGAWEERNSRPRVEEHWKGSIFLVQGLQDWNVDPSHSYPWVNELAAKGLVVKHLLGQWPHAHPDSFPGNNPNVRWDWAEILKRWFDRWLKDLDVELGPAAQVQDSDGNWRNEATWPPADAARRTFWLAPEGALADAPAEGEDRALVSPDADDRGFLQQARVPSIVPRPPVGLDVRTSLGCLSCPRFATPYLEEEMRFAGLPQVHLTVTPQGPGGYLAGWLYVQGRGATKLVGWGGIDLRFADGTETPRDVAPGEPLKVLMELEPLDVRVPEGSRLVLVLRQTGYGDHVQPYPAWPMEVHVGGEASTLMVEAFARAPGALFRPPGT